MFLLAEKFSRVLQLGFLLKCQATKFMAEPYARSFFAAPRCSLRGVTSTLCCRHAAPWATWLHRNVKRNETHESYYHIYFLSTNSSLNFYPLFALQYVGCGFRLFTFFSIVISAHRQTVELWTGGSLACYLRLKNLHYERKETGEDRKRKNYSVK
jgi:hypothetical protein